jgi:hypothetical protein
MLQKQRMWQSHECLFKGEEKLRKGKRGEEKNRANIQFGGQ